MLETTTSEPTAAQTPPVIDDEQTKPDDASGQAAGLKKPHDGRPSPRDRGIYERHVLRGETQEAIAADQHCSRQRVSQICRKVERWLATHPDDELAAALRVRCQRRFDALYVDAFQQFQRSKQDLVVERERTSHRVPDGQPEKGVKTTVHERLRRQQNGDARFLNAALRAVERMERIVADRETLEADQGRNAEGGTRTGEAKGRQVAAAPAKPWWVKNDPVMRSAMPVPGVSAPLARPAPVAPAAGAMGQVGGGAMGQAGGDATGQVGGGAMGQAGGGAAERHGDEAAGRETDGVRAPEGEGAREPSDKPPAAADSPHSELPTPPSSSRRTPHSISRPPLRDTVLIVGAPDDVRVMATFAREKLRDYQIVTRTSLVEVADWLEKDLDSTALISLDDDLGSSRVVLGEMIDPGTIDQVVTELIKYPACCPVVLNTAQDEARRLMGILISARWDTHWAKPTGGHWLKQDWLGAVKRRLRRGGPRPVTSDATARRSDFE